MRDVIRRALLEHAGNRTRTARTLGIERSYLLGLIKRYAVDVPVPARSAHT